MTTEASSRVHMVDRDGDVERGVTPVSFGRRDPKLSFGGMLRSEWIKLFTLRSTWWILAVTIVVSVGICALMSAALRASEYMIAHPQPGMSITGADGQPLTVEPGSLGLLSELVAQACGMLGQLVFIILSILIITNEYSSGMIRSTLTIAPRRSSVLFSKMIVVGVACVVVFGVSVAAGWGLSAVILHGSVGVDTTLASATSLRILGGFILEMVLVAWLCFGLGAIIRSSAGGIGAAVGLILVLPMVLLLVSSGPGEPTGWRKLLADFSAVLPTNAGGLVTQTERAASDIMGPWEGVGVLGIWVVVCLVLAFVITSRRDI